MVCVRREITPTEDEEMILLHPRDQRIQRSLQALAHLVFFLTILLGGPLSCLLIIYLTCFTRFYWLALAYVCYVMADSSVSCRGSRSSAWVRRWKWWELFRDYFPVRLVKTTELDPTRNYLLCAFPHGCLPLGIYTNFATEATNVSEVFPGITHHVITMGQFLSLPLAREVLVRQGLCSSSAESINYLLDPSLARGRSAVLVVGGGEEAITTRPDSYHIVLAKRKGFVRLAIRNGACLVPVISFGENDLYELRENLEGSWSLWGREFFHRRKHISIAITLATLMFKFKLQVLPRRTPITTVVGEPIEVDRNPEPTQEQIDDLHRRFQEQLVALFEEHKHHYIQDAANMFLSIE